MIVELLNQFEPESEELLHEISIHVTMQIGANRRGGLSST